MAECSLCMEACPVEGCISDKDRTIHVDREHCMGCGICTAVCPSGAINLEAQSDKDLYGKMSDGVCEKRMAFGCFLGPSERVSDTLSYGRQSSDCIKLPCLGLIKESHLIAFALAGFNAISLDVNFCSECSIKYGRKIIEKTVSYATNILSALRCNARIRMAGSPDDKNEINALPDTLRKETQRTVKEIHVSPECSRRELFSMLAGRPYPRNSEDVDGIPDRRSLLLEAFKGANLIHGIGIEEGTFPVHNIKINNNCRLCYSCELFCPSSALKRVEENGEVRIDFQLGLCMGCHQCKELCPEGAIYYGEDIDLKQLADNEIKTVIRKVKIECPVCGHSFIPEDNAEGCPTCRKKKDLDKRVLKCIGSGYAARS